MALTPDRRASRAIARAGLSAPVPDAQAAVHGRYALCLDGSQGDADFLPLAGSHAVVLKEQDGWESFVTPAFRPWRHHIPLAPGGGDLSQRLT